MKMNSSKNRFAIGLIFAVLYCINIESVNSQLDFGGTSPLAGIAALKKLLDKVKDKLPDKERDKNEGKRFGEEDDDDKGHNGRGNGRENGHGNEHGNGHGHVQLVPQSLCTLKADPGYCNLIIGRWYYDHRYHRCLPFLFTGCGGNPNNFMTLKKCDVSTRHCHLVGSPVVDPLTKYALTNPLNPLGNLANGYILAG